METILSIISCHNVGLSKSTLGSHKSCQPDEPHRETKDRKNINVLKDGSDSGTKIVFSISHLKTEESCWIW